MVAHLLLLALLAGLTSCSDGSGKVQYQEGVLATGIVIEPSDATLELNDEFAYRALVTFTDGRTEDVTEQVAWSVEDIGVAGAGSGNIGMVQTHSVGLGKVTARFKSWSGTTSVRVTTANLVRIEINPAAKSIKKGSGEQYTATGFYDDGTHFDITSQVKWESTDIAVATVADDLIGKGMVNGVDVGSTVIKASWKGINGVANIGVVNATLMSLRIDPALDSMAAGLEKDFHAIGTFSDGSISDMTGVVTWQSADLSKAIVDNSTHRGRVKSIAAGVTLIRAVMADLSAEAEIIVTQATLLSIEVSPSGLNLASGTSQTIIVTGVYSDGSTVDLTNLAQFTSSNPSTIEVDNGVVTVRSAGNGGVNVTFGGQTETIAVTGTNAVLTALEITPSLVSIPLGNTTQMRANGRFSDSSVQDLTTQVTWSSSDATRFSISNATGTAGLVTSAGIGTAQVSATLSGVMSTADVQVTNASLISISLSPASISLAKGQTSTVSVWALYSDGSLVDVSPTASWLSSDNTVLAVGNSVGTYGQIRALGVGSATVTVSVGGQTVQLAGSISAAILSSLQITPPTSTLPIGTTTQLVCTATYSDSTTADVSESALWSSDASSTASVSNTSGQKGKVSALTLGSASVKAALSGQEAQAVINTTSAVLSRIEVSPQPFSVPLGTSQRLTVTGIYSDGSTVDLTTSAVFNSSDATVLSVSNSAGERGKVTAAGTGSASLSVSYGGMTETFSASATAAVLASLEFSPSALSLANGTAQAMVVTGIYSDGSTVNLTSTASWSSSDTSVLTVNNSGANRGLVQAVAPGNATLTASYQGVTHTMTVINTNAVLSSLQITPATLSFPLGNSNDFSVTGQFSDGTTQNLTSEATWSTVDSSVAIVSNAAGTKGRVTSQAVGSTLVVASVRGQSIQATLSVTAATLVSISTSAATLSLPVGTFGTVTAWGHYSDGSSVDITSLVLWSSSANSVASVGNSTGNFGKITALSQGTATVTASLLGQSATIDVTSTSAVLTGIQVNAQATSLPKGLSTQFSAVGTYSDASTADLTTAVLWSSSNTAKATVSNASGSRGSVLAVDVGTANIKASLSGVEGNLGFTISAAALDHIEFYPATLSLARGLTQQMTATGIYTDGSTVDLTTSVSWSSTNGSVLAVSNTAGSRGLVSASGVGTATLSANLGGVTKNLSVTITPATLTSIALSATSTNLAKGTTKQFSASGTYTDGTVVDITSSASWSSSDISVSSVSNSAGSKGLVTALTLGHTTISASLSGHTGNLGMDVTAALISSITVSPSTPSVARGLYVNLSAVGVYTDLSTADLTSLVSWSSSAASTASVSNSAGSRGRVTGNLQGNATITATYDGVSGDTQVSVTAATLLSISISGYSAGLPKGLTRQLTATGNYSDSSTSDLTTSVTWASATGGVLTVSNAAGTKGLMTGQGIGTSVITATLGAVTKSETATGLAAVLTGIAVTPAEAWIPIAAYFQYTATGTYSDGTTANITTSVVWSTSDILLMSIDNTAPNKGRARGIALGAGTFTATFGSISGTTIFHGVLF